jgi:GTPase SAR1 family protein
MSSKASLELPSLSRVPASDEGVEFKVAVFGRRGVGKSCLQNRFLTDTFTAEELAYGTPVRRTLEIGTTVVSFEFKDNNNERRCDGPPWIMRHAKAILFVYDVTDRTSLERGRRELPHDLDDFLGMIEFVCENPNHMYLDRDAKMFVVGNKADLDAEREVSTAEGAALAAKYGFGFFETSARDGTNVIELLTACASHYYVDQDKYTPFHWASYRPPPSNLSRLFARFRAEPYFVDVYLRFKRAVHAGHVVDVAGLIADKRVDPSGEQQLALRLAAKNGHVAVVKLLLLDVRVDPSALRNAAVRAAAQNGHADVVACLLRDARVGVSDDDCHAIRAAAENGHLDVVELLLPRAHPDPSGRGGAICAAAMDGHVAVVERLLRDERIDPSVEQNGALRHAARHGQTAVVDVLLRDVRVDPRADNSGALRNAAFARRYAVVERLVRDGRADVEVALRAFTARADHKGLRLVDRARMTEICVGLQDLELPAWITVQVLAAACPWSAMRLGARWDLVCAVKHFHRD